MSGNEAFARGIYESGVGFAANYPGTPLSEVGEYLNYLSEISKDFTFDYSLNEKVALESCIGASWAGVRSVAMFKHLGLNVAADPLHTFPYSGVNGGMLILCGGDPGILSSTNAQDNRLYSLHTKIPIIEPGTVQECKDFIKEGLRFSELYQIPVYIHVNTRLCHSYGIVEFGELKRSISIKEFKKEPNRFINTRGRAIANQKKYFEIVAQIAKNKKLYYLFNKVKLIKEDNISQIGVLTSGISYSYVLQACRKLNINPPILKLGLTFPINHEEICKFTDKYDLNKLLIIEELEPFMETVVKSVYCNFCDSKRDLEVHGKDFLPRIGELNTDLIVRFLKQYIEIKDDEIFEQITRKEKVLERVIPSLPIREPTFCAGCPDRPVFYALKKVEKDLKKDGIELIYGGDISCAALAESYPYEMVDWIVCMGAGVGIANGMAHVLTPNKQKIISFMGDSTFFHCGIQPTMNAIKNNIDITIIIFYNYWTAMTGHQQHIGTPSNLIKVQNEKSDSYQIDLVNLIRSLNIQNLTVTKSYNINSLKNIFLREFRKTGVKIIIIEDECALVQKRRFESSKDSEVYYTITDTCIKCNECIEALGCPAINVIELNEESKYEIDMARCIPKICPGACKQVCRNDAIKKTEIFWDLDTL